MDCKQCKARRESDERLIKAVSESKVVSDTIERQAKEKKWQQIATIVQITVTAIMAACMIWAVSNSQRIATEVITSALEKVAEIGATHTETTTTQSVEGNAATINNVDGEQYNDTQKDGDE